MLKRYYTCEVIDSDGNTIGGRVGAFWFWISPFKAYLKMLDSIDKSKTMVNFRKL